MQCTNCEAQLNAGVKFCRNCGQPVDSATVQNAPQTPVQNTESNEEDVVTIDTDEIAQYFVGYGNFFKETLIKPSSVFSLDSNTWVFGLVNLIILAMLNAWMYNDEFFKNFLLEAVYIGGILGALFLVNQFLIKRQVSFLDIIKDFGGLMSLQLILMLVLKLLAPEFTVDSVLGLLSPGSGLGFFIFLTVVAGLHILLAVNYYVLRGLKNSQMKLNPYYQLVIANIIYFAVNYVIGMLITA